ncbi:hypothetical protein Leryth_009808 [Lithospermum erythrorhizon]|nr:hypothetical protein Leryth_009808 [Lithospermum erythrorhizon]
MSSQESQYQLRSSTPLHASLLHYPTTTPPPPHDEVRPKFKKYRECGSISDPTVAYDPLSHLPRTLPPLSPVSEESPNSKFYLSIKTAIFFVNLI